MMYKEKEASTVCVLLSKKVCMFCRILMSHIEMKAFLKLNLYHHTGRELVACKEAVDRFQEIVSVIGGDGEKTRAKELLTRLTVVPGQDFFKVPNFLHLLLFKLQ